MCIAIGRGSQCIVSGSSGIVTVWALNLHNPTPTVTAQRPIATFEDMPCQVISEVFLYFCISDFKGFD
jgi:hypothetical protein